MVKSTYRNLVIGSPIRTIIQFLRVVWVIPGAMIVQFVPALALENSTASTERAAEVTSFTNSQEALRAAQEALRAGKTEAAVSALSYAAESGKVIARWKLGEIYASGDGVKRDDKKAYYYFNQLVETYDEDNPNQEDLSAVSDAFVAVGVYCLSGLPNSDVGPDPQRAHELFQYAATTFADPNAQYNLARMYMTGVGVVMKDNVAALRWLALAANTGHSPSQALLGHMLFVGKGMLNQRARGLMWLELANDETLNSRAQWIRELYQRDFQNASKTERLAAESMREARIRGTPPPAARTNVTSLLQPFDVAP